MLKNFEMKVVDLSELYVICFCLGLPISEKKTKPDFSCDESGGYIILKWAKIKFVTLPNLIRIWRYRNLTIVYSCTVCREHKTIQ